MFKALFKNRNEKQTNSDLYEDVFFNRLRDKEYNRLNIKGQVYLDYTGGNLYGESQITKHYEMLKEQVFGNPHSTNPTSKLATILVDEARESVLEFFNASDYYCIFTQNASGGLQIVGECYPFNNDGHFLLFSDNHNSVNGIREYCKGKGGNHEYIPLHYHDLQVDEEVLKEKLSSNNHKNKLFAYPAQSNVSGIKHSLDWIAYAKNKGWDVLLDAAAYVPTSKLDLSKYKPDYVTVSFYKIFGYPTGLGCLLVKKDAFSKLKKPWFAGGTVSLASAITPYHFLIDNHERFENGTINYLDIPAVKIGLDYIKTIGMERINQRVESLMNYLYSQIKDLKHDNGQKILNIFGSKKRENSGGTLIMNFNNPDGSKMEFEEVEKLANASNISIRSGCFCNPGIDEINNCLTTDEIATYFSNRETGNYNEMIASINKMRGANRISVGIATTKNDLDLFISFVKSFTNKTLKLGTIN